MNDYQKARLSSNKQIVIEAENDAAAVYFPNTLVRRIGKDFFQNKYA